MDEFEGYKDTEIEQAPRWFRVQAISHFLIGVGTWILLVVFGLALITVFHLPYQELASQVDEITSSRFELMMSNFLVSSMPMILTALIMTLVMRTKTLPFLSLDRIPKLLPFLMFALLFVFLEPLLPFLLEINEKLDISAIAPKFQEMVDQSESASNSIYSRMLGNKLDASVIMTMLFMAVLPALAEELFFRGFLLRVMHGLFRNFHIGNLFTSLIFAGLHFQFYKLIPMIIMSMTFGYIVYFSRSVWVPIIIHMLNNIVTILVTLGTHEGNYGEMVSEDSGYPVYVTIIAIIGFTVVFYLLSKRNTEKLENLYE